MQRFICCNNDEAWRLSPAFDLVPNIGFNQEHVLRIGIDSSPVNLMTLLAEAKHFGIKQRRHALDVVIEIHEVVSKWDAVFTECGVPDKDAVSIDKDIIQRLKRLK
ncbi:HipA domain-containing protein [Patescibacteria group bacterium]|nr:HipA domain-containing protein [Patescibacteria group bacterium]